MKSLIRLMEVLKRRFPSEQTIFLAAVLASASEKGRISYDEMDCDTKIKRSLLLLAYEERLLLPIKTSEASCPQHGRIEYSSLDPAKSTRCQTL